MEELLGIKKQTENQIEIYKIGTYAGISKYLSIPPGSTVSFDLLGGDIIKTPTFLLACCDISSSRKLNLYSVEGSDFIKIYGNQSSIVVSEDLSRSEALNINVSIKDGKYIFNVKNTFTKNRVFVFRMIPLA